MRLFRWLLLSFIVACTAMCQETCADEQAAAKNDAAQKDVAKEKVAKEKEEEPKEEPDKKTPSRKPLVFKPKDITMPVPKRVPKATAKRQGEKKAAIPPAIRRPNAPLRPPLRRLNAGAAYRLENMGRRAHLTPAMQFHLNRSGATAYIPPNATNNRQRPPHFYPGVSRLPAQKPFANIERPQNALERYWPLLLEGRQDPNTGLIIWSLP